jgi:hypothetical protein
MVLGLAVVVAVDRLPPQHSPLTPSISPIPQASPPPEARSAPRRSAGVSTGRRSQASAGDRDPRPPGRRVLRSLFCARHATAAAGCSAPFSAPDYNDTHRDPFHLDLGAVRLLPFRPRSPRSRRTQLGEEEAGSETPVASTRGRAMSTARSVSRSMR